MIRVLAQSGDGTPPSWGDEFHAYSTFHLVAVTVSIGLIALTCALGRRWSGTPREYRLRLSLGVFMLGFHAFGTLWRLLPEHYSIDESLPLHMCRLIGWISAVMMLTGGWRWRALTFYWGVGLSTQAFITPMWSDGYASVDFWLYWGSHALISAAAAYDLFVGGFFPSARDLRSACAWGLAFTAATALFNLAMGTNYSYLGAGTYDASSVVDFLGPWPRRITRMILLAGGIFFTLHALAHLVRAASGGRAIAEPIIETT